MLLCAHGIILALKRKTVPSRFAIAILQLNNLVRVQDWKAMNVGIDTEGRAHALISVVESYRQTLADQRELAQVQRLERHPSI